MRILPEQEGVQVRAAGEQEAVAGFRVLGNILLRTFQGQHDGQSPGCGNRPQIGGTHADVVIFRVVRGRDRDKWLFHNSISSDSISDCNCSVPFTVTGKNPFKIDFADGIFACKLKVSYSQRSQCTDRLNRYFRSIKKAPQRPRRRRKSGGSRGRGIVYPYEKSPFPQEEALM